MVKSFLLHTRFLGMALKQYPSVDRTEAAVFFWGATVYLVLKAITSVSSELEVYLQD